jgi:hypothetical protein
MGKPICRYPRAIESLANCSASQIKELFPNCRKWFRSSFNPARAWQKHNEARQKFYQIDSRDAAAILTEQQEIQQLKSELPPGNYVLVAGSNQEWYFTENSGEQY